MSLQTESSTNVRRVGEAWDFSQFVNGLHVPNCIASYKPLSPGARLLWAAIAGLSAKHGYCWASNDALAAKVGVSGRQVQFYCAELERQGFMRSERIAGRTAYRWLLRHKCFGGPMATGVKDTSRGARRILHGGVKDLSPKYFNLVSDLTQTEERDFSLSVKARTAKSEPVKAAELLGKLQTHLDRMSKTPSQKPKAKNECAFSPAELDAIRRPVEEAGFKLSLDLTERMISKAQHYQVSGFRIGAVLNRALAKVGRNPSYAPKSEHWFSKVVENELKAESEAK